MVNSAQCLAVAATAVLFGAICFVLRSHGIRTMASACLFVASLTTIQLFVGALGKPPFSWKHPGFLTTLHFACVWIICAVHLAYNGEPQKIFPCSIGAKRWLKNILPYALCMPVSVVLNNEGIMAAGPGLVAIIGTLSPIVTALISRFFGRKIALISWMGVMVAMVGGAIISWAELQQAEKKKNGAVLYGMICAILSVAGRAMKIVISDWLLSPSAYGGANQTEEQLSFMHIYVLQFSMGDLVTLVSSFCKEGMGGAQEAWGALDMKVVLMIIATCIPATCLNFMGGVVLRELGATLQQLVGKLNTLVVAAISMAFLGEHLSKNVLLGTCFVLGGVAIFEYGMRHDENKEQPKAVTVEGDSSDSDTNESESDWEETKTNVVEEGAQGHLAAWFPWATSTGRLPLVIILAALWWSAAIFVTLMFKVWNPSENLSDGAEHDKLPRFTLTFLANTCTGIIALALTYLLPCEQTSSRPSELEQPEWMKVGIVGIVTGCEMGCLNKSLQFLSISQRTFFQNANVLLTMVLSQLMGLESLTALRMLAGLLLGGGAVLQMLAAKEEHSEKATEAQAAYLHGITLMVCSMVLTSIKWAIIQIMTQRSPPGSALGRMSKLRLTALVQPITGVMCLMLAILFEVRALEDVWNPDLLLHALATAVGITVILCSELKLVQLTSAVTCGVLINLHHIPIVVVSHFIFGDIVSLKSMFGWALCILGGCVYVYARSTDRAAAPRSEETTLVRSAAKTSDAIIGDEQVGA